MAQGTWRVDDKENEELQRQEYRLKINEKFKAKQTPRLGEDLNKQIDNLPIIRHWNEFQERGRRISQEDYERRAEEGGAWNQFSNAYSDLGDILNEGLSTTLNAPIEAVATLLNVDPGLLSKTLTIAGLGRGVKGVKGVKPRLKTINQNVLPTTPKTPKALTSKVQQTLHLNRQANGAYGYKPTHSQSGHTTTQGLTLGIPQATSTGTRLSPVPTAPLVAANGNGKVKKKANSSTPVSKDNNPLVDTGVTRNGEPIFEQKPASTGKPKRVKQADIPEGERVYITDIPRSIREKPPTAELIEYAKQQGIPVEFAEKFSDDSVRTFNQQKKSARTATHQAEVDINKQADAGHYYASSTESAQHLADLPGQRGHTPITHGDTARPQPRIANRLNDPNDHINIHIADSVGLHTTWAKKLQAAWDVENGKYVFNFKADLSLKGQEAMLNIDVNLPRSQAIKARDAILADPSNLADTLSKQDLRDLKLEQKRTQIEHYTTKPSS
jgi:hypothetical protein